MERKKALFFDIDGTIWDRYNRIPESTAETMKKLRENGHLTFLCSGRCRSYIQAPSLFALGFDGVVSGCGTMVEYRDQVVFYHRMDNELVAHTLNTVRRYGFRPILEGRYALYLDPEDFAGDVYGEKLTRELGDRLLGIRDCWGKWEISKLSCETSNTDRDSCFRELEAYYDYMIHNVSVAELVPKGFHKGVGIQKVCEHLGLDVADTFAFGDSANDLGMLRTAGTGVAMGNGSDEVKASADYVTTALDEDGIRNACQALGLI